MPSTTTSAGRRRPRRSAEHWQTIIRSFEASGLGPTDFCRREKLSFTSFDRWRRRFLADDAQPGFVELRPESPTSSPSGEDWTIEIDLPGGVSLRIRGGR